MTIVEQVQTVWVVEAASGLRDGANQAGGLETYVVEAGTASVTVNNYGSNNPSIGFVVGGAIGGHKAVRRTASGLVYASADDPASRVSGIGITLNAASAGGSVQVQYYGEIVEPSWNWIPDFPVYLGLNGNLTQAVPGVAGQLSWILGFATNPQTLFVAPREPITLA